MIALAEPTGQKEYTKKHCWNFCRTQYGGSKYQCLFRENKEIVTINKWQNYADLDTQKLDIVIFGSSRSFKFFVFQITASYLFITIYYITIPNILQQMRVLVQWHCNALVSTKFWRRDAMRLRQKRDHFQLGPGPCLSRNSFGFGFAIFGMCECWRTHQIRWVCQGQCRGSRQWNRHLLESKCCWW